MATSKTYYLPEELAMKVVLCLPVKDLVRCKLVCKQWLSITLDPDFIQTHLTNSHKRPSVLTSATVYDMKGGSHHTVSIISDSVNIPVPPSCLAPDHSSTSCNGLMCLSDNQAGQKNYEWSFIPQNLILG
ncbi:hypothetical protein POM88_049344 [Heracleum sosnowskyi]|uniref:F-box domain-containing protein n=1 Tax=Heracleum sosnowskyi TaxID=360622 RepID=A0AAD8M1L1_9APIA|nr:hypothetical protein POM88_049344 [Heracleum sosnowskyi]